MRYVFPISNNNTIFFTGLYQHWKHWLTAHPGRAQTVDCHTLNQDQPFFNFLFALVPSWRTDRAGQCIRVLGWPVLPKQKGHTYKINKQITLQNSWVHGISLNWIIESGKLGLALDSFHYFDKALWLQDNENEAFFFGLQSGSCASAGNALPRAYQFSKWSWTLSSKKCQSMEMIRTQKNWT